MPRSAPTKEMCNTFSNLILGCSTLGNASNPFKSNARQESADVYCLVGGAPGFRKDVTPLIGTSGGLRT